MQDNMPSCTLYGGFSRELHSADYSWGISIKSPRAYFINSGAIPRRQLLKSTARGNLKSTSKVAFVGHTPRVLMQGRKKTDSY
jgi:hypothetical protein